MSRIVISLIFINLLPANDKNACLFGNSQKKFVKLLAYSNPFDHEKPAFVKPPPGSVAYGNPNVLYNPVTRELVYVPTFDTTVLLKPSQIKTPKNYIKPEIDSERKIGVTSKTPSAIKKDGKWILPEDSIVLKFIKEGWMIDPSRPGVLMPNMSTEKGRRVARSLKPTVLPGRGIPTYKNDYSTY